MVEAIPGKTADQQMKKQVCTRAASEYLQGGVQVGWRSVGVLNHNADTTDRRFVGLYLQRAPGTRNGVHEEI
jgi:hypothetical protein